MDHAHRGFFAVFNLSVLWEAGLPAARGLDGFVQSLAGMSGKSLRLVAEVYSYPQPDPEWLWISA